MKIALIYDCIYPYVKGGGEKRYYEIAQRLKNKHEIHIFGMKFWQGNDIIKKDGIYYHGVCKPLKIYTKGRRTIFQPIYFGVKLLKPLLKQKLDLIDCAAFPYFSVFPAWIYSKIKKIPFYVTWHEYWGNYWYEYLGFLGFLGKIVEKITLILSTKIIAVSKFTANKLIKAGAKNKNIRIINNGIEFNEIRNIKAGKINYDIIFAGRLIKEKNISTLIKSIKLIQKEISNVKCLIIGEGPERKNLEELVTKNQLTKNIIFKNFLDKKEDLFSNLKSSKLFVLPSTREGFGMIINEANACGLPAIAINNNENAAKDLIINNKNGFISNFDEFDLAIKIKLFLQNQSSHVSLRSQSIEQAKKYDWDNIILNLEKYYKNLNARKL